MAVRLGLSSKVPDFFRGISLTLVAQVAGAGIGFVAQVVFARLLGVEAFGEFVLIVAWITILSLLGKGGLDGAVSKNVRAELAQTNLALAGAYGRYAIRAGLVLSIGIGALVLITQWLLSGGEVSSVWVVAMMGLPLITLVGIESGTLRGIGQPVWSIAPQTCIRPIVSTAILLVLFLVYQQVSATLAILAFGGGFLAALFCTHTRLKRERFWSEAATLATKQQRDMHYLGVALVGATGAILMMRQADILMLGFFREPAEAGFYAAAVRIVDVVAYPMIAANTLIGPLAAEAFAVGNTARLQERIKVVFRVLVLITFVLSATIFFAGEFLLGVFGREFVIAVPALGILLIGQVVNVVAGPGIEVLSNSGNHHIATVALWVFVALNLVLNALLIPRFGILGAASATALCMAGWNITMALLACSRTGVRTVVS